MISMIEVAVVGGGPAGAYCAYNLAKNGCRVSLFDDSHPREKPCGGLVSPEAQQYFPFLKNLPMDQRELRGAHYSSSSGTDVYLSTKKNPFLAFSRLKLDHALVEMALVEGTDWVKERVVNLARSENSWKISTPRSQYSANIVVGADGHTSLVRKSIIGQLDRDDYGFTFGYLLSDLEKSEFIIRFLPHRKGYIWVIPRRGQTSSGIWCTEVSLAEGLKKELDAFLSDEYPDLVKMSKWASLIPNVKKAETFKKPLAGKNWAIIGDAAGHVDPITGEGILFALLDGEIAASAIMEKNPMAYESTWRKVFLRRLTANMKMRKIIYNRVALDLYCNFQRFTGPFNR